MGKFNAIVTHLNNIVRTLLLAVVVGGVTFASYQAYVAYSGPRRALEHKDRELTVALESLELAQGEIADRDARIESLREEVTERDLRIDDLEVELDRVQTAVRLHRLQRRLARIEVLEQPTNDEGRVTSKIRFVEIGDDGQEVGDPAEFTIDGDRVYVEYLVVKFDDDYVERADLERGTAICLFERIFGENQEPGEGFVIDRAGSRPTAYQRGSEMSEFEAQIWKDFWTFANDPEKAKELGIRASHAQAPSIRVKEGNTYELDLRATGEFSLRLVEEKE